MISPYAYLAFERLPQVLQGLISELKLALVTDRDGEDHELLLEVARSHEAIVTLEEGSVLGGAGSAVGECLAANGLALPMLQLGLPDGEEQRVVHDLDRPDQAAQVERDDGVRDRERRAGPAAPPGVSAVNLQGLRMPEAPAQPPGGSALFEGLLRHAPTWDDIAWLQGLTHLPILLKGVLHPADAQQAQSMGLAGVIVSNHGGRTLDTAVSTAWALPQVVDAVGPDWPVLVDGGIRRGTDVFKALALGAHAVLIGRPYLHGLAVAGALGVAHVIRLLRDELEIAMALNGCRTLSDIRRAHLLPGPRV